MSNLFNGSRFKQTFDFYFIETKAIHMKCQTFKKKYIYIIPSGTALTVLHRFVRSQRSHGDYTTSHFCRCNIMTVHWRLPDVGGGWVRRRCPVAFVTGAPSWYWLTVGQGLLFLQQVRVEGECCYFFCSFTFSHFPFTSLPLSFISSTISSISFLPFSGRRHKLTKPQLIQSIYPTLYKRHVPTGYLLLFWFCEFYQKKKELWNSNLILLKDHRY